MFGVLAGLWRRWSRKKYCHVVSIEFFEGVRRTFPDVVSMGFVRIGGERYIRIVYYGGKAKYLVRQKEVHRVVEHIYSKERESRGRRIVHSL